MLFTEQNVVDVANIKDLRTTEVLLEEMGNACSPELEDHYAKQWEEANLKALVRSYEETESGKIAASYHQRRSHFEARAKKEKKAPLAFTCAPEIARMELETFNRVALSELVRNKDYQRRMNEYRAVLDLPPVDFDKLPKKLDQPDYEQKAAEFIKMPQHERLQAVRTCEDRLLLGYVISDDPDREVRAKAQARLFELAIV